MPKIFPVSLYWPKKNLLHAKEHHGNMGPQPYVRFLKENATTHWAKIKLEALLADEYHSTEKKGGFIYRMRTPHLQCHGLLCGLSTNDINQHKLTTHEATLPQREIRFAWYLKRVQIQAEPVLVMHESDALENHLLQIISEKPPLCSHQVGETQNDLWELTEKEFLDLQKRAESQAQFHLADGHHRMASTRLAANRFGFSNPLFTFLVHQKKVIVQSFVWAIKKCPNGLMTQIKKEKKRLPSKAQLCFTINGETHGVAIPKNVQVSDYLNTHYLNSGKIDKTSIHYLTPSKWEKQKHDFEVAIHLNPLTAKEIIQLAQAKKNLLPKTTYILPKLFTGLYLLPMNEKA